MAGKPGQKFGEKTAIGTTDQTVWPLTGILENPAAPIAVTISSSSANDTAAGTGARTVEIQCLIAGFVPVDETYTLNGQTAVAVGDISAVNRLKVMSAGSNDYNVGTIYVGSGTVTAGVPAVIYAVIAPGNNKTTQAHYTCPI